MQKSSSTEKNPLRVKRLDSNYDCVKKHRLNSFKRLSNYPFNIAAGVMLVSFESKMIGYVLTPDGKDSTALISDGGELPVEGDSLCFSRLKEQVLLSKEQVDSLTDILYNYGFRGNVNYEVSMNCYSPHHAIVFLDHQGKMFEFIELCFMCNGKRLSSEEVACGDFCDGKYELLEKFFKNAGVRFNDRVGTR